MTPEAAKRLRLLASAISVLLLLVIAAAGWLYWRITLSVPRFDGTVAGTAVAAPVTIERDANGVPTIRAQSRVDAARALGWLHGQERFFQMDLLRRNPAGELAELFGKRALPRDRANRLHGLRAVARQVVTQLPPEHRTLVEAYVAGVNAGLGALRERPFEYLVLRVQPRPWTTEDSVLAVLAMALDLQDENGTYERSLMTLRDELGADAVAFFAPVVTPDDAALDGTTAPLPPIPGSKVINLRTRKTAAWPVPGRDARFAAAAFPFPEPDPELAAGSNAFGIAGSHTATGAAILANDMHLGHSVPNIWYRAVMEWPGPDGTRRLAGVTLPGAPAMVAGSNGRVAWGFTNSCIDTVDLVEVDVNSISRQLYRAPGAEALVEITKRRETFRVHGAADVVAGFSDTVWGPVINPDVETERTLAVRWTAHDPAATNFALLDIDAVDTVEQGVALAHRMGIPVQNFVVADRGGAVAWTLAGRIPRRVGFDGRLPVSWSFGDRKWDGYLPPEEIPVVRGADTTKPGLIWSGNQRHVGGAALARIGEGAYRRPARAAQIRDGLAALHQATPGDVLAVQLDDRALFLERWHRLLQQVLTPDALAGRQGRTALRRFTEKWEGRASTDAVSYRLVREFRLAVHARLFDALFADCRETWARFEWTNFLLEPAAWTILEQRPAHLLPQPFASWDEFLLAACDDVIAATDKDGVALPKANWGWRNTARVRHPFSSSFPWLSGWLDMPADPLPGGDDMPRYQSPTNGASERLVVSPGREAEGIFHMPAGQSGHPMSPFYRAGHSAWVRGEPTPFLPGKTQHTLTLQP